MTLTTSIKRPAFFALFTVNALLLAACSGQSNAQPTPSSTAADDQPAQVQVQVQSSADASAMSDATSSVAVDAQATSSDAGTSQAVTLAEVAQHNSQESCYTVVDGKVYDVTSFIPNHPGGPQRILQLCGNDGSDLFNGKHGESAKAKEQLAKMQIGVLAK